MGVFSGIKQRALTKRSLYLGYFAMPNLTKTAEVNVMESIHKAIQIIGESPLLERDSDFPKPRESDKSSTLKILLISRIDGIASVLQELCNEV